jgi:transcription initiation factor TFIIIB Brf1 subunit/transcription initiation factor TFIIB
VYLHPLGVMLTSESVERCRECSGAIIDAGDELVCRSCGAVTEKAALEAWVRERRPQAIDYTAQALGGYLGPLGIGQEESSIRGFARTSSTFEYLKKVSDFAGRDDSTVYSCTKMIERVCEKLTLPNIVIGQAVTIAKKLLAVKKSRTNITTATVSAYSVINACKIEGVASVGVREIVEAHRLLGRRVKTSALIELSFSSQIGPGPRRAEDYVSRVIGRLSSVSSVPAELEERRISPAAYFNGLRRATDAILARTEQTRRGGHSPCTLAATAVYAAEISLSRAESRKRVFSQKEIAACVNVAEYTVREQYGKVFRPILDGQEGHREFTGRPSPTLSQTS